MADRGILVQSIRRVGGVAEVSPCGIAACLRAEAVANAVILVAEVAACERFASRGDGLRAAGDLARGVVAVVPRPVAKLGSGRPLVQVVEHVYREVGGCESGLPGRGGMGNGMQQTPGVIVDLLVDQVGLAVGADQRGGRQFLTVIIYLSLKIGHSKLVMQMPVIVFAELHRIAVRMTGVENRDGKVEFMRFRNVRGRFQITIFRHKNESLALPTGAHRLEDHAGWFEQERFPVLGKGQPEHEWHTGFKDR